MVEFLINPNLAYMLLVGAFWLAIIAILSPGTGFLELTALLVFVLAGWQVINLDFNLWAMLVLLLGVFPFYLAVRKSGRLVYLGLSILTLVGGSLFLFTNEGWRPAVHPLLAVFVSALTAGFMWLVTIKTLEAEAAAPSHDLEVLLGSLGESRTPVDLHGQGSVQVGGELWTARSLEPIPPGTPVRVIGREGFILDVEAVEENE